MNRQRIWSLGSALARVKEVISFCVKMSGASDVHNGKALPKKLHGRAFYESLGSPKFVLAPMVDQSEFVGSFM